MYKGVKYFIRNNNNIIINNIIINNIIINNIIILMNEKDKETIFYLEGRGGQYIFHFFIYNLGGLYHGAVE